ncbi:MAG: citrate/2-methylcitrate synthase [Clostridia bacterium]|nr:citrate/2-methylcitrate synthase [Clostridia bacterium]
MPKNPYSELTPELLKLSTLCEKNSRIEPQLYIQHKVNRGLRDLEGKGVLTGLTEISEVTSSEVVNGEEVHIPGRLFYRGYDIKDLTDGFTGEHRFGFEEATYLLLFGKLPNTDELREFSTMLGSFRTLPTGFVRDIILKAPSRDMMNTLARCVLTLYAYDEKADDISLPNVLRQCLHLISLFPVLAVYGYQSYSHYHDGNSLFIHLPRTDLSSAENILYLLRPDSSYTALEAKILDLALVLHAEHGGGNNSTFTTHVVSSSGTDTYSAIAASLGSLKGPKHGGANIKVMQMMADMKEKIGLTATDGEIRDYLSALLNKEAFDKAGLIYGMGHAVYSVSDPRAELLCTAARELSAEKGKEDEFALYSKVAELAPEVIAEKRRIYKGVSPNVDFYSGFIYSMLDLPVELYTPIFAVARITGWSAHRMEELINAGKIIRPAYMHVSKRRDYVRIDER